MAADTRPQRNDQVVATRGTDDTVLLNPRTGKYYTLDEVGSRVWELCDGTRTIAEVVALIVAEYDAPLETVEADVTELLTELADEQLVITNH